MQASLDLAYHPKAVFRGHLPPGGSSPDGTRYDVKSFYFEKNGQPWHVVAGEFHYSRCQPEFWTDGLAKMKAGGVNLVSTYVFWNHHEEIQGQFRWDGQRDLRSFLKLVAQHGLVAVVRLGPFCHGEVRNGGVPDWVYGQPWEARSNDAGYLKCVRRLYGEIGNQLAGLFVADGGPVLAAQIENEYQHSAAPWEVSTATSKEWLPGGRDGRDHMLTLMAIAKESGIRPYFWTATAWGGACVPLPETLPLWGGYAYQPWLFYGDVKEHPVTQEYLFRDHHNNAKPKTYNFEPTYRPEDYPYSCCEMGGGMQVWYPYRFQVEPASVEAMAMVKTAGGCNFLGYYMYAGGTNPLGEVSEFLNEHTCPKLSYDFQAPLGETGQVREHFHRLRLLHLMLSTWQSWIVPLPTVLPPGAEEIDPRDNAAVRWSLRTDGRQGLLFVTNYQDHWSREALTDLSWTLSTDTGAVRFPAEGTVALAPGESCALPFRMPFGVMLIESATAQPVTVVEDGGHRVWVFAAPEGMEPVFLLKGNKGPSLLRPAIGVPHELEAENGSRETLLVLSKAEALGAQLVEVEGRPYLVVTSAAVLSTGEGFLLEQEGDAPITMRMIPSPETVFAKGAEVLGPSETTQEYTLQLPPRELAGREFQLESAGAFRARLTLDQHSLDDVRDLVLRVEYSGDVGQAFADGLLVADNFSNGAPWDISLGRLPRDKTNELVLSVVPLRQGGKVVHDTTMAGRLETSGDTIGKIHSVSAVPVRQVHVRFGVKE